MRRRTRVAAPRASARANTCAWLSRDGTESRGLKPAAQVESRGLKPAAQVGSRGLKAAARRCGFTLVEVLVTLTIGSLLVVSVVSVTRALSGARERVDQRVEQVSAARHAMETIVAALRNVRRDPTRKRPVLIGRSGARGAGNDGIDLLVIGDRRCRPDGAESDQHEVSFQLSQRPGERWPVLMCRRDHALDERPQEGGIATVVAEGVVGLSFAYYTGAEWVDEWSSLEPKPPKAVRVTVAAIETRSRTARSRPEPVVLSTVVPIRVNEPVEPDGEREGAGRGGSRERPEGGGRPR